MFVKVLKKIIPIVLITVLHVSLSYCMDQTAEQGLAGIEKLKDAQQVYERGTFEFLRLLGAKEALEYDPYACFRCVLASPGQEFRELRAFSAYNLGLMCRAQLGVPREEMGISGAKQYFLKAIHEGHIPSLNELARCEREAGNEAEAHELWRQENFLELCQSCAASKDASARDEQTVEQAAQAIALSEALSDASKQQPYYSPALNSLLSALKECAGRGQYKANCLLARLYVSMPDKNRDDIIQAMAPILSSCPDEQRMPLIDSTGARPALRVVADVGNVVACAQLGIALYNEKCYAESYHYCSKAAQQGDLKARCYCIIMEIMGLGKPKSLPGAAREIQELVKSEEGRQSLKFLAQFYDACVCNELTNVKPKLCKHAAFIHGVILYQLSSNDALAYTNLSSCAGENLYARYCCANMLLQGRGTSKLIDEAASKFRSICGEDDLDGQLRAECWTALREIAATGSIAGLCEYCMACMHKAVPLEEFRIVFDRIWRDHEQRASCLRYLLSASSTQVISRARQENNLRAILLSSFLQVFQCGTIQTIDTKLQLMETAYREIVLAHENKVASDSDFCFVSLYLAMALREKGSLKEARECLEKVAHYDSLDVKIFLAVLLLEDKNSTQEDLQRALGYYEESATKGEVEHQRLLAASYRRNNRAGAANLPVQADIGKSYKFVSMLLAAKPEDVEGRYILGYLLANHGGQMGVPADQHEKAYELLSFAIANKKDVLPEDYYLLGSVCCANRNFELAVNWLERAGDSPQCKCALGLAMLYAVEHGSTLYNREQALTLIEGALSSVRHLLVAKQESYSKLFQDELLVKILTEEVRSGNFRAQTMLARIAYLFDGGVAGVSKERAYAYLVEAAEAGVASAQSFLGFVFLHGIGVQQVESTALERFIKVTRCENVPDFIYDEVAEELFALGRELVASPVHVKAACYGIIALLHNSRPENVKRALMLFEKAELDCLRNFVADKDVTAVIYQSGAWDALKRLALLLRNGNFTSALGMSVIKRFQTGCVDLRFLLVDGLPLIRLAVRQGVAIEQVSCFSQQLLACVYYALQVGGCDFDTLRSILETTQQLDPENKDIAYALATIYMNHKFPDVVPGAGQAKLEALADGGHPLAALDMGVIYLSLGQIGNLVANFKQGIQYLEKAAKKGSCHALSLMASVFLKEKDHNAQYVKKQLQESIEFLLNQRNVGTDEKLFFQAMKALASKRYDEAVGYVAQLSKNPRGAILCILACRILIPHRDGCEKVGAYLISSLEIVCSNHVNIVQAGIIAALRDILIDLDKAASDCKIASYASAIKELLSRYNINLGKV